MSLKDLDNYILGIEEEIEIKDLNTGVHLTELNDVKNVLRKRSRNSHRGPTARLALSPAQRARRGFLLLNLTWPSGRKRPC